MQRLNLFTKLVTMLLAPILWAGYYLDLLDWVIPLLLLTFLLAQWIQVKRNKGGQPAVPGYLLSLLFGIGALLCALSAAFKSLNLLMYYPVAVNTIFLGAFAVSLRARQTVVEIIAQRTGAEITPQIKDYTRKVTIAWCCFFVVNGSIALYTALEGNIDLWTLWNGCLSYVCIGLMTAGEYLVRKRIQKRDLQ